MSVWKPISQYPCTPGEQGPLVLARDKEKSCYLVLLKDGHFVVCPAVFMWYGDKQRGILLADNVVEFMEIPA